VTYAVRLKGHPWLTFRLKGHPWLTFSTSLAFRAATVSGPLYCHYRCRKLLWITDLRLQLRFLWPSLVVSMNELYWAGIRYLLDCAHKYFREVKRDSIMSCVV
jgi:hypothetical protein